MPILHAHSGSTFGQTTLALAGIAQHLHRRTRLLPLLREAIIEEYLVEQAGAAGLSVSDEELQKSADLFRRRRGLTSAEKMQQWLSGRRLSLQDFESALERDLLIAKYKDFLTRDRIAASFEANRAAFERLQLRQIVVEREDFAREIRSQIEHEGRDFAELARQHSVDTARRSGGAAGWRFRCQLPPGFATCLAEAAVGSVCGPVATSAGFTLLLIEQVQTAQLDAATSGLIREQLFQAWLTARLAETPIQYPILNELA